MSITVTFTCDWCGRNESVSNREYCRENHALDPPKGWIKETVSTSCLVFCQRMCYDKAYRLRRQLLQGEQM